MGDFYLFHILGRKFRSSGGKIWCLQGAQMGALLGWGCVHWSGHGDGLRPRSAVNILILSCPETWEKPSELRRKNLIPSAGSSWVLFEGFSPPCFCALILLSLAILSAGWRESRRESTCTMFILPVVKLWPDTRIVDILMQTMIGQIKTSEGMAPSVIWVMLHMTFSLRREGRGHRQLWSHSKSCSQGVLELWEQPRCTQVSVTSRMAAPSITKKWNQKQNKLLVCRSCSHSCALFLQSSNLC